MMLMNSKSQIKPSDWALKKIEWPGSASCHENFGNIPTNIGSGQGGENFGAGNETRTRDLYLGKVSLYQLSYSRIIEKMLGGASRSRTDLHGFAIRCITALLSRRCNRPKLKNYGKAKTLSQFIWSGKRDSNSR